MRRGTWGLICLLATSCKSAPPPSPAATPETARAAEEEEGTGFAVLSQSYDLSFDAEGRSTQVRRLRLRLLGRQAVEHFGSIGVTWAPWYQARPIVAATVLLPDGRTLTLDPAALIEGPAYQPSPNVFSDRRVLEAPLPGVTVGAVVETVVTRRETGHLLGAGSFEELLLGWFVPVEETRVTITAPESLPLRVVATDLPAPVEKVAGGTRTFELRAKDLPAVERDEPYTPADQRSVRGVFVTTARSWSEVAGAYASIVEEKLAGAKLGGLAKELAGSARGAEAIAAVVRGLHARVRYTGLELGANSLVPRAPAEVLAVGYGDCKDKSVLLAGLLRALGFQADIVLVGDSAAMDLPGVEHFDHAIVTVADPPTWIDATLESGRPGELPVEINGLQGLIARPGQEALVTLPDTRAEEHTFVELHQMALPELGRAKVVERTSATGALERYLADRYLDLRAEQLKESLAGYVGEAYQADTASIRAKGRPPHERFELVLEVETPTGYTDETAARAHLDSRAVTTFLPEPLTAKRERDRRTDLRFRVPHLAIVRHEVALPAGIVPRALPPPVEVRAGPARLARTAKLEGNAVVVETTLHTGPSRWTRADVKAFRESLPKLEAAMAVDLELDHQGRQMIAAGDIGGAVRLYAAAVKADGRSAAARIALSRALLKAGLGEAARREAKKAVELAPELSEAHFNLGFVLEHDLLGTPRGNASPDFEGAAEAYRKCKALLPNGPGARSNLAMVLLEAAGPEPADPRRAEAIAELKALHDELGDHSDDESLLGALIAAERWSEALAYARKMPSGATRDAVLILSRMAVEGPGALPQALAELGSDIAKRREALELATAQALASRRYAATIKLLEARLPIDAKPADVEDTLAQARKLRNVEVVVAEKKGPAAVVLRYMAAIASGAPLDGLVPKALAKDRELWPRREDANPLLMADLLASSGRIDVEGSEGDGWLVTVQESSVKRSFLVALDGKEPRVLAELPQLMPAALTMAAWLDAKNVAAARALAKRIDRALGPGMVEGLATSTAFGALVRCDTEPCLRVAAALFTSWRPERRHADLAAYEAARGKIEGDAKAVADVGMAPALVVNGQAEKAVAILAELRRERPDAAAAIWAHAHALAVAGKRDEAIRLLEARRQAKPYETDTAYRLAEALGSAGKLKESIAVLEALVAQELAWPAVHNQLAWTRIYTGELERALDSAREAVRGKKQPSPAALHTLATIYAEMGRTAEAIEVLRQEVAAKGGTLRSAEHYVLGRLAEAYGLAEDAKASFAKVEKPAQADAVGVYALMVKRTAK